MNDNELNPITVVKKCKIKPLTVILKVIEENKSRPFEFNCTHHYKCTCHSRAYNAYSL